MRGLGLLKKSRNAAAATTGAAIPNTSTSTRLILGQSVDMPMRTRFAPSPTGYLHLGSLRTALFNNLAAVAAGHGSAFVLRIEDTDQSRLVRDAEVRLLQDLSWAGLSWDEGPDCGGPFGPYRQSERLPIYKEHVQILLDSGHAFRCFCSPAQLDAQKRALRDAGRPTFYPGTCRALDAGESASRAARGEPHVVRFRDGVAASPSERTRSQPRDAIYGAFENRSSQQQVMDDFIILKSDGFPTYHLACVVDDHLMKITHVIRGEEWLISTPKHLALYQAFRWQPPTFAHLGLLVNLDGTKLSKRNDAVNLARYRDGEDSGIFPVALLSWLANLGSSFKPNVEPPRSVQDIADALTFKFTRGGIKLNFEKLTHFNDKYRHLLLRQPSTSLSSREAALLRQHVLSPAYALIRRIAAAASSAPFPAAWAPLLGSDTEASSPPPSLELVPSLLSPGGDTPPDGEEIPTQTALAHLHAALATTATDGSGFHSSSVDEYVAQHPYLFWRPPRRILAASVAASPPDRHVLDALDVVLARRHLWEPAVTTTTGAAATPDGVAIAQALGALLAPLSVSPVVMHDSLRLVAAGSPRLVSQSSGRMFSVLGRDEWSHRLARVRELL